MKDCKKINTNLVAFLYGELGGKERIRIASHLLACLRCKEELEHLKRFVNDADSLREDMEKSMASVDWDALPEQIADRVFESQKSPSRVPWLQRFRNFVFLPRLRPVYAGLLAGIILGSFVTFMVFRSSQDALRGGGEFSVTPGFLKRIEIEATRRETLDYLEKSQYLLLDFVQSPAERSATFWSSEFASERAKDLLSKKKYINQNLDKFQMAKAKAICDQIELLFYELTQVSDQLSPEDLQRIQNLIEEKQILLKIKLLKKELEKSEV